MTRVLFSTRVARESLLGMGDMLYSGPNSTSPVRVHGAFVRDQEVHAVVQDWKARGRPQYVDGITSDSESEGGGGSLDGGEELDPLFDQAVNFVTEKRKASISRCAASVPHRLQPRSAHHRADGSAGHCERAGAQR